MNLPGHKQQEEPSVRRASTRWLVTQVANIRVWAVCLSLGNLPMSPFAVGLVGDGNLRASHNSVRLMYSYK
jgi:hypothetical protein